MKLQRYAKPRGYSAIANVCGCSLSTLKQIACGSRQPSLDLALRISGATGGVVTVAELAPELVYGDAARARLFPSDPLPDAVDVLLRVADMNGDEAAASEAGVTPDAPRPDELRPAAGAAP